MNTLDSLMEYIEKLAQQKGVIDVATYLGVAEKINSLLQNEQDKLYLMEQEVAKSRKTLLDEGKTASHAKIAIEASDAYREARSQKAKIDRAIETIRISKAHARLSTDIYKSN